MTKATECGSKQGFACSAQARTAMNAYIHNSGASYVQYHVYRCRFCRLYHFGHRLRRRFER